MAELLHRLSGLGGLSLYGLAVDIAAARRCVRAESGALVGLQAVLAARWQRVLADADSKLLSAGVRNWWPNFAQ